LHVRAGAPAVIVRREDLIVTREERERFERDHATLTHFSLQASVPVVALGSRSLADCLATRRQPRRHAIRISITIHFGEPQKP